jgi:glycosyltransferase involved in cell wall biosynthesis
LPARKILIITLEPVAEKMAGPAIRSLEIGRQLASEFGVTVYTPAKSKNKDSLAQTSEKSAVTIVAGAGRNELYALAESSDVLFIQANVLKQFPALAKSGKYLAVDLYDPYLFSLLEQYEDDPITASSSFRLMHQVLEKHMLTADFSVCASERQRDYWLGRFCAVGRINPELYRIDASLRKLIDVVPYGVPDAEPVRTASGKGIKGNIKGIEKDDQLLLWGGGIWDWFDPLTIIRAVDRLKDRLPKLRLFFMGVKSPNPQVPLMPMAKRAKILAEELGLLDKHVFFSDQWIDYEERVNYLLDADIAVSAHFDLIETRFSFRTRILDYLWTGLPILTTAGDDLADLIQSSGAGFALPHQDVQAWAEAVARILESGATQLACRQASAKAGQDFHWSKTVAALRRFCHNPYHLPPFTKVTMPSLLERAHAVYSRGGKELVIRRSKELFGELLR